jgi:ubiquinone/menaquinone biosynthesis C-methylase UbiE
VPVLPNPIIETYSRLANEYDGDLNLRSCWGRAAEGALACVNIKSSYASVVDIGCGTGRALRKLASRAASLDFIGIEPALNMRRLAVHHTAGCPNVRIRDGRFEQLPLESGSVDYIYSIFAFHWTTDLEASVHELSRVLKPDGEADLFLLGRNNGREFIQKTTPIFFKYMGPARLLASARMRKQLAREEAVRLFERVFTSSRLSVDESYDTYYDTLAGHWGWWVRIEGHFMNFPSQQKDACYDEVRAAIATLAGPDLAIPYTIHKLHVHLRNPSSSGRLSF